MTEKVRAWPAALLLLVVACGSAGGRGSTPLPLPSPPTTALAAWADFPANANPRPIIWLDGPNTVVGYPGNDAKIAGLCNKLILDAGLNLSTAAPLQAEVRWPSGASASYRAISATTAFGEMLRLRSGVCVSMCDSVAPLVITTARFASAGVQTDRGTAQLSSWLFQAAGVQGEFGYPGLDPSAYWHGGLTPAGNGPGMGARVSGHGRTLTISFMGTPDDPGPCGADYTAAAAESDSAVAVAVKMIQHPSSGPVACNLMAQMRFVIVQLAAPLGGRVLLDENGNPSVTCEEGAAC